MLLRKYNPLKMNCNCNEQYSNNKQKSKDAANKLGLSNHYKIKYYNSAGLTNNYKIPPIIIAGGPFSQPEFFISAGGPFSQPEFFMNGGNP
jgi:hypothetical protein